jgi:type I site-specific restriction endonuclease
MPTLNWMGKEAVVNPPPAGTLSLAQGRPKLPKPHMNKRQLSESDICAKYITPHLVGAGWDATTQIRREVSFTQGRIIVRGKLVARGRAKCADYILYYRPNLPIALIEAKDNNHSAEQFRQRQLDAALRRLLRLTAK